MVYDPAYPSGTNTFVPVMDAEGTAGLVVNFSRNPKDFALPRWASYTPVKRWQGLFLRMTIDQCARVLDVKGNRNIWPLGNDAPQLTWNTESFAWMPYLTERYAYGFVIPDEAEQQGDFSVIAQNNAVEAQRAMTQRTTVAVTAATTTGNYDATHVDTAANWGGGYLGSGTPTNPIFKRALETMYRRIHLDTRGTVKPQDMVVVMSPAVAHVISQGEEIHTYLKESPYALGQMTGGVAGQNTTWGLPPRYADFQIVVEDAVKNPNAKGAASQEGTYCWPWDTLGMFARPGGLIAPEGATSFSTVHVWLKEDMSVESFQDPIHRRTTARIVDFFGVDVVAPVSGCLCTSILASQPTASLFPTSPPAGPDTSTTVAVNAAGPEVQGQLDRLWQAMDQLQRENATLRSQLQQNKPDSPPGGETDTPAESPHDRSQPKREGKRRDG